MKLTVILPNFNHARYLRKSLAAIADQRPDEFIVIDDASTDDSWGIIKEFAQQHSFVRAYRNGLNLGGVRTVEQALLLAQGDYVYCAAADDYVLPGFFEKSMALLAQHPEAGLCCTIGDWQELHTGLNWNMGVGMANLASYLSPRRMVELERAGRLFIACHTVIAKRSALFEVGGFPIEARYAGDWLAYNLIGFQHGICVVPERLAVNQIGPDTYFNRGRRDKAGDLQVMENLLRLLGQSKYQDAVERMRESGALYLWGFPMLRTLLRHPEYAFLTPALVRKTLWHSTKRALKNIAPASVVDFGARLAGYQVGVSKVGRDIPYTEILKDAAAIRASSKGKLSNQEAIHAACDHHGQPEVAHSLYLISEGW